MHIQNTGGLLSTWFGVLSFRNVVPKLIIVSEFVTKQFHTFKTHILLQDFAIMTSYSCFLDGICSDPFLALN